MTRPPSSSNESPKPFKFPKPVLMNKDVARLDTTSAMPERAVDSTNLPRKTICISPVLPEQTKKRAREVDSQTESYTCVAPDVERDAKKMRLCNDNQSIEVDRANKANHGKSTDFPNDNIVQESENKEVIRRLDHFLSYCHLCMKRPHGLDIFMYRGDEAFCSPECREAWMKNDNSENSGSDE